MSADFPHRVKVRVDAGKWLGDLPHNWNYIGYAQVFSDGVQGFYMGSTDLTYDEISITTYCPANWYPIEKSSVYVDCAQAIRYE